MTSSPHKREKLEKTISFRSYVTLGLGIVVGIGWVVYSGQWLKDGGPLGAIIAFLIGGLLLIPVGKCYAELTSAIPVSGGEIAFSFKAFGPFVCFLTAWIIAFNYVMVTPFETIAIGTLLESIVPAITTEPIYYIDGSKVSLSTIVPGVGTGIFLIWLNYKGVESSTKFQAFIIYALIACTLVFTAVAFIKGDVSNLTPLFATKGSLWAVAPASIISVIVVVPWFLSGFDAIPQAAEEAGIKMDAKQLGTAIILTIIGGTIFYILIILAVAMSMPWQISSKLPFASAEVFKAAFGYAWVAKLVLITALMGLVSTLNGMYIAASRVIFALGRGGLLPRWFADVHPVYHTPRNALLFVGVISLIGPFVGKAAMGPIVNSSSLGFSSALIVTCLAAIRLRHTAPSLPRPYKVSKAYLYAGAAISFILVLLMILPQSSGQLAMHEFLIVGIWMAFGIVVYFWQMSKKTMDHNERSHMILGEYR